MPALATVLAILAWVALGLVLLGFLWGTAWLLERLTSSERLRKGPETGVFDPYVASIFHDRSNTGTGA